ncbi:DUF3156 family protein [Pseudomonas alabamensis]|jgi:hypothetical protein|uniref:DUF3156 family protein n=1 Tax=Pseudomonas alabamensis TaxID=3064349 RepID=UPI003F64A3F2
MIRHLREKLTAPQVPADYRPGVTLEHLLRNLEPVHADRVGAGIAQLQCPAHVWQVEVHECTESHLLMHVVTCEFRLSAPALQRGSMCLALRHTGTLRRTGVAYVHQSGDKVLFATVRDHLGKDAALLSALMPLDFKRLTLECRDGHWQLTLEHMGGSEVVNRLPAFRRYIQVSAQQRLYLLACLTRFASALPQL